MNASTSIHAQTSIAARTVLLVVIGLMISVVCHGQENTGAKKEATKPNVEDLDKAHPSDGANVNNNPGPGLAFSADSAEAKAALGALPRSARTQLTTKILPALKANNFPMFVKAMEVLVSKQEIETIDAIDAYCQSIGIGKLKMHLTNILARYVQQGLPVQTKGMDQAFTQYIVSGILQAIASELAELGDHALMQDPLTLPDDWRDSEQLFWEVHVWKNRFLNIQQMISAADLLQKPALDRATRKQDDVAIEQLQKPKEMAQIVKQRYQELTEREAELRIRELAKAESVLRNKPDFESQLNAAFVLEMHGGALDQFFRENPPGNLSRARLNDPSVLKVSSQLLASGREHGKEVIEKAVLLRVGAHWWLRGRYGVASMAAGLLKPPGAMKSPDLMFGLFMPRQRPQAIGYYDEETGYESTGYDRRHYFTWAVERRDLVATASSRNFGTPRKTESVAGANAGYFW